MLKFAQGFKMIRKLAALALLALAGAQAAHANEPSFSCVAARAWEERAICADANLAALDVDLDRAFRTARTARPDEADALIREQRTWLAARARTCRPADANQNARANACLAERTQARIAELIRWREGKAPAISLQHKLNRGAAEGDAGEAALAAGESAPELAVAALLALARGDQAEATRRIAAAEARAPGRAVDSIEQWARASNLDDAAAQFRRALAVLRRDDMARDPEAFDSYRPGSRRFSFFIGSDAPVYLNYSYYAERVIDNELKLPCRILERLPDAAMAAFAETPAEPVATIIGIAFDCPRNPVAALPEGRAFMAALAAQPQGLNRQCRSGFHTFGDIANPVLGIAASVAPQAVLRRLGGLAPASEPSRIWPDNPAPLARAWRNLTHAMTAEYLRRGGVSQSDARRLADAVLAEIAGLDCAPPPPNAPPPARQKSPAEELEDWLVTILKRAATDMDGAVAELRGMDQPSAKANLAVLLYLNKLRKFPVERDDGAPEWETMWGTNAREYPSNEVNALDNEIRTLARAARNSRYVGRPDEQKLSAERVDTSYLGGLTEGFIDMIPRYLPCDLVRAVPDLLELTEPVHLDRVHSQARWPDCDLRRDFPVPASVSAYAELAMVPSGGETRGIGRSELWMHVFPNLIEACCSPEITRDIVENWRPYEAWSYMNLSNRRLFERLASTYLRARTDLSKHYQNKFGMAPDVATTKATMALRRFADEGGWLQYRHPDRNHPRHLIMAGASLAEISAAMARIETVTALPELRFGTGQTLTDILKTDSYIGPPDPLLHVAAGRPDVVRLLLTKRADPREMNAIKKTAAMGAAQANDAESLRAVLAAGTPIHAVTSAETLRHDARSALHYAASGGLAGIRFLLAAGADPQQPDSKGMRPIHYLLGEGPAGPNRVLSAAEFRVAVDLLR